MKRMLRWRIRRCVASLLVLAMTVPLGHSTVARMLAPDAATASSRRPTVVVFEFVNRSKEGGEGLARTLTRQVRLALEQSSSFDLVTYSTTAPHNATIERAIQDGQLTEQELTGPPEPAVAVKIARILGAEFALLGELDEDGYEYNAEQKRVTLRVLVNLYNAGTGEPVKTFTVTGTGEGDGLQGVLEDRARVDLARNLEMKLAGREPKPPTQEGPRVQKWLPWALGGVAVAILAVSLFGGKGKKGPAAPVGAALSVTATRNGVRLAWTPVPGADSYRIYRAPVAAPSRSAYQQVADVPATVQQFDDTPPVVLGVRYAYQVAAVAGGKEGARLASERAVAPGEPSMVSGLQATVSLRSVSLSWSPSNEDFVVGYRVYRSTSMDGDFVKVGDVGAGTTSFTDTGLAGGTTYFYKVAAVGETGQESEWRSMPAVARSTDLRPAAPAGVTATAVEGERRIVVSWRASAEPDLEYYQVYRGLRRTRAGAPASYGNLWAKFPRDSGARGGPYTLLQGAERVPPTVTSVVDTNVEFNTTYYYVVRAVSSQGESPYSDEAYATPNRRPGLVQNVAARAGDGRVTVTWGPLAEPDIAGYHVYRQVAEQPTTRTRRTEQPVTGLQFEDRQVTNDTRYQYFVTAVDTAGWEGLLSVPVDATPTAPPEAPRNVRASAGNNKVTLVWDKNAETNLAEYRIYRSDSPNLTPVAHGSVPVTSVDPPTITFTDENAQNLVTYYYQVTAVNTSGVESARSPSGMPVSATPAIPPAAPQGVQAEGGERSVTISWQPVTRLAAPDGRELSAVGRTLRSYRIYRTVANTGVRTLVEDVLVSSLQGQPRYEDRRAPVGVGLRYSVTATMLDSSDGVLESDHGRPVDDTPVVVTRRINPPANFAAQPGDTEVTFTWTASTDPAALGYVIYGSETETGPYSRLFPALRSDGQPTVSAATTTYRLTAAVWPVLRNDTRFWFRIATVDRLGTEGTLSTAISVMPNPPPPAPVDVVASNTDATGNLLDMAVRVSWKAPVVTGMRPIYGYRVFRSKTANGPWELAVSTPVLASASPSFLDQFQTGSVTLPEANGQDFYYRVLTLVEFPNAGLVESVPTAPAGPVRVINVPPGRVENVRATATNGVVTVRWDPLRDAQGNLARDLARYTVSRRVKGDTEGVTEVLFPVVPDVNVYYDTEVTAGTVYEYRVQAVDFITEGPWSTPAEVMP